MSKYSKSQYNHLEKQLSNQQFGYRAGRSTEFVVTLFLAIRKETASSKVVGAVLCMDLSRAFQTIHPATVISKLRLHELGGTEHDWFNEYLLRRKQIIYLNGEVSPEYPVVTGVPQGSLPRPMLFLIV